MRMHYPVLALLALLGAGVHAQYESDAQPPAPSTYGPLVRIEGEVHAEKAEENRLGGLNPDEAYLPIHQSMIDEYHAHYTEAPPSESEAAFEHSGTTDNRYETTESTIATSTTESSKPLSSGNSAAVEESGYGVGPVEDATVNTPSPSTTEDATAATEQNNAYDETAATSEASTTSESTVAYDSTTDSTTTSSVETTSTDSSATEVSTSETTSESTTEPLSSSTTSYSTSESTSVSSASTEESTQSSATESSSSSSTSASGYDFPNPSTEAYPQDQPASSSAESNASTTVVPTTSNDYQPQNESTGSSTEMTTVAAYDSNENTTDSSSSVSYTPLSETYGEAQTQKIEDITSTSTENAVKVKQSAPAQVDLSGYGAASESSQVTAMSSPPSFAPVTKSPSTQKPKPPSVPASPAKSSGRPVRPSGPSHSRPAPTSRPILSPPARQRPVQRTLVTERPAAEPEAPGHSDGNGYDISLALIPSEAKSTFTPPTGPSSTYETTAASTTPSTTTTTKTSTEPTTTDNSAGYEQSTQVTSQTKESGEKKSAKSASTEQTTESAVPITAVPSDKTVHQESVAVFESVDSTPTSVDSGKVYGEAGAPGLVPTPSTTPSPTTTGKESSAVSDSSKPAEDAYNNAEASDSQTTAKSEPTSTSPTSTASTTSTTSPTTSATPAGRGLAQPTPPHVGYDPVPQEAKPSHQRKWKISQGQKHPVDGDTTGNGLLCDLTKTCDLTLTAGAQSPVAINHNQPTNDHEAVSVSQVNSTQSVNQHLQPSGYGDNEVEPVSAPFSRVVLSSEAVGYDGVPVGHGKKGESKVDVQRRESATKAKWRPYEMNCATEVDDRGTELCTEWAKGGLCEAHRATMFLFCRRTCLCVGPQTGSAENEEPVFRPRRNPFRLL